MTCTTCGRDNAAHLTFCQECGQRLGPRIAPPTPPIGLGGSDAYVTPVGSAAPARVPSAAPRADVASSPKSESRPAAAAGGAGERRCRICDTLNAAGLRYCTSCGSTLEPPTTGAARPAQPPVPTAPPAPTPAPQPVAHVSQPARAAQQVNTAPVAAAPVAPAPATPAIVPIAAIDLAPAPREASRTCRRCNAATDASAQFCKFCGNSLAAEPAAASPPAPANGAGINGRPSKPAPVIGTPVRSLAPAQIPSAAPIGPSAPAVTGAAALAAIPLREALASRPPPAPTAETAAAIPRASTAPQRGRLVLIAKSGADGPSYPFGDLLDVGRLEGNVIIGEDPYLSPRHVRIVWSAGKLTLRDLGSTNGVYLRLAPSRSTSRVDGEIAIPLVDQDLILIGQQVLRFEILRDGEGGFGPAQEHGTLLFGSPAAPRYARLCQRTVEGITRDVYYVRKVETVLGRESGDVVFTEDPFLSRRHAAIRLLARDVSLPPGNGSRPPPGAGAKFSLVDLGSSNGTFVRIRSDVELSSGDHFRVGQQLFRVDFDAASMRSSS